MNITIDINIDDLLEVYDNENIKVIMQEHLTEEVQKVVKRHPQYKAFIQAQAEAAIRRMMGE